MLVDEWAAAAAVVRSRPLKMSDRSAGGLIEATHEGKGKSYGEPRPAYCVLAYTSHVCPPTIKREPSNATLDPVMKVGSHGFPTTVEFHFRLELEGSHEVEEQTVVEKIGAGSLHPLLLEARGHECDEHYSDWAVAKNADWTEESSKVEGSAICN
ncbi:MAG: hypothetical protein ABSB69_12805 [Solirubrobacteraceae bacterium]